MILRTSLGERAVRSLLGSLEISLTANATDAVPQGQGNAASASGKHDLSSKTISGLEISNVLFAGEQTYIIWKPTMQISRPKVRLQRPAVYFTASLSPTATAANASRRDQSDVLKSFETLPANVLEPLQFDTALGGSEVYLPENRITRVLPTSGSTRGEVKPIRGATKRAFPLVPALFTRIRYSTLSDITVASLHLEASHLVSGTVELQDIRLEIEDTHVRHLTPSMNTEGLLAGAEKVEFYILTPSGKEKPRASSTVSVQIRAKVHIDQSSSVGLQIGWQAQVDLTKMATKPGYKWSRPLSGGPVMSPPRTSQQLGRPSTGPKDLQTATGERGITFNFTAPPKVDHGTEFRIDVHCVNRSSRTRRFALVMLHAKRQNTVRQQADAESEKEDLVGSIYDAPASDRALAKPLDVLDLNPDVRIGPLQPGAIFQTALEFQAVASGPLDLGVIRIVDLDTRQTVDVKELPDVIALGSVEESTESSR